MLKLKRVEIHGFKSFYDRTEMKFNGSGIAAVVGPNGCGKSNLSDAISWVLGEQSAKTLRGARMEDVIFAGTRDRKALGMAAVTMTLVPDETALAARLNGAQKQGDDDTTADNAEPSSNLDVAHSVDDSHKFVTEKAIARTGEITITRRLYRSGESEYLINGKQARLRDIQDLFLGTGLGPESYAIIEQGRIGQILSNRPQDRRNVIEEAAGITKFKTRKRLAEAKLESAKQNLARVFDILEEVTRQANSLKRQAAKTKRYGELKSEASGYLRQVLAGKFRVLEREMGKIAIELNLFSAEWQCSQAAIVEREAAQDKLLADSYANDEDLTEARKQLADLKLEGERTRGRLEYQTKQVERITQTVGASGHELRALAEQQAERSAELEARTTGLVELEGRCAVALGELAATGAERQRAQESLTERERALESRRQQVLALLGETARLKNRLTQMEGQLASTDRDRERIRKDEAQSQTDAIRIQQSKGQLSEQLALRQTALISVEEQRKAIESELQQARAQVQEGRAALDRLKGEASRLKARKDSLEEVIQHRSYTTETVKRLFTAVERGKTESFQPAGVLADFLEVEPGFEKATEEFLHDELEYVVVRNWTEGERGIELMRGDLNGRGTFLVEDAGDDLAATKQVPRPAENESLTKLTDALRWTNGLSEIPMEQLPRIANCYVATERALARELATQFPYCWFLTSDGVNYHGQAVSGGKKSGAGPLALKRELREIAKVEEAKQADLKSAQERLAEQEQQVAQLGEELDRLRSQQQAQERDVLALDHESRKLAEESGRVQSRLSHARIELDRMARERVQLEESATRDGETLREREQARASEETGLEAAREELAGLRMELARLSEEHATKRAELAAIEERRRSIAGEQARLETQLRDLVNRSEHISSETERMESEKAHLLASNVELAAKAEGLQQAVADAGAAVDRLSVKEAELRSLLAGADEELKRLRAAAQIEQEQRAERQVAFARAESQLKHLEETCSRELDVPLAELAQATQELPDETELGEDRERIRGRAAED